MGPQKGVAKKAESRSYERQEGKKNLHFGTVGETARAFTPKGTEGTQAEGSSLALLLSVMKPDNVSGALA